VGKAELSGESLASLVIADLFMGINQKAILMHMKQHFPTSDCWTNVKLSKQKLAKVRRN